LLATWTGREPLGKSGGVTRNLFKPWVEWFSASHPAEAENLAAFGGMSAVEWMKRLGAVNWSAGDATRGATVFRDRACATCHQGASRLGPALTGITARFNRDDLFLHIVEPNLAISPTYAAQDITLRDGTVHFGVPVYQSVAITLLEVAPNTTIRLTGDQIASATPARRSAMPEGLLIGATDSELADLYAYLQTLVDNPNARKQ
jgi:putative heme-binding domain-containing protein